MMRAAFQKMTGSAPADTKKEAPKEKPKRNVMGGSNPANRKAVEEAGMKKGGEVRGYGAARKPMKKGGMCRG